MLLRLFPGCAVLLICAGCMAPDRPVFNRAAITKCLPPDVTLDTVASAYSPVDTFTVEQHLIELGAHVDKSGILRSGTKKKIVFVQQGEPMPPEAATEECDVVTITGNPTAIPGR